MQRLRSESEIIRSWCGAFENVVVSIACITFNHESFIENAIISFLMQKTDFPFEVLIYDDASTDKTASIIKKYAEKYPSIIKPVLQTENQFSRGVKVNPKFNFSRAQGEYIALCEGDDYWIDSKKLSKQVTAFEDGVSLIHSDVDSLNMLGGKSTILESVNKTRNRVGLAGDLRADAWLRAHSIFTCTMMFKKIDIIEYIDTGVLEIDFWAGDYSMFLFLSQKGNIKYLDCSTAVYRTANGSIMNQKNKSNLIEMQLKNLNLLSFYFSYFDVSRDIKDKAYGKIKKEIRKRVFLYSERNSIFEYRSYFNYFQYWQFKIFRFLKINKLNLIYMDLKSFVKKKVYYKNIA
ncbi:glycosyltransferase [Pseudoalteromonas sp. SG43-4]|uniref:glycosyltransferase n=1 Tax=Pseudoalteromonas sp. SG43-4 TaxID=2760969 RepID=UPI001603204E|nr:glycosyltransferase [Pseudoalteromonas sp. SG43-4]MBB1429364.1 glycosyltransferase [Pseudoalteromonas sp. SG43-4]